jgi:hypothetical protein
MAWGYSPMKYLCWIFPLKADFKSGLNFRGVDDLAQISLHIINSLFKET